MAEPATRKIAVAERVLPALKEWAKLLTRAEVVKRMREAGLAAAPVNGPKEIARDPHFSARRMIETIMRPNGRPISVAGNPVKMSVIERERPAACGPTKIERPGESSREILRQELDLSDTDLEALGQEGVIGWPTA
jgi:formyl-CoA transferase